MRYTKEDIIVNNNNIKLYRSKLYPNIPISIDDLYVVTTIGDRLDLLAFNYYKDVDLWWVIYIANNNLTRGSLYIPPGTQVRIPSDTATIIQQYNDLNKIN